MAEALLEEQAATNSTDAAPQDAECGDCIGSGGWYRYDPSLDPSPGRLYLSCVQCRGSGRTALARG